ncbi:hypothetical protein [Pseudoglutamicibacter cumminsii]|uniref:hypothetical protein n=1 Tax=Pseudoglutamicibacter cumminsii TaxID=156979 RepID=UPI003A1007BD
MFPAVASSATATQAPASSHSAKPASVASNLATQNQASTNAAMAPARVNSSVCAPNTSFGILESGQLLKINTADGTTQNLGSTNLRATYPLSGMDLGYDVAWVRKQQVNGLGVTPDGNTFYAFRGWSRGSYQNGVWVDGVRRYFDLFKYDANGNNPQRIPITENGRDSYQFWELSYEQQSMDLIAGAVNPADGRYYFGGFHQENNGNGRYNLYFALRSVDPKDGRLRHIAKVFVESKAGPYSWDDANGDIVFDQAGNFHLLFAKQPSGGTSAVKLVTIPESWLPVNSDTPDMPKLYGTSTVTRYISGADGVANSLSVDSDGQLIIATVRTAFKYDPTSFFLTRQANQINGYTGLINTDLASCHTPPTLEVKKDVVQRIADNDQFRLTADDQAENSGVFAEATTSGTKTGVQEQQVGPAIVRFGGEYIINEEMAAGSTSKLSKYETTLSCEASYPQGGVEKLEPTPVSGQQYKVKVPEYSAKGPANVACTYTNAPPASFKVKKDSAEAGAKAEGGEWTSAYTVTVTNDGEVAGTSKPVTDTPSVPEGFKLEGATVDGKAVELVDGSFTVTDGVKLAAGKDKVFEVVLSGTYEADKADWVAVGECDITGEGDPKKGLFNKVAMEGDSDGPENNDACNPVSKDPSFKVKKDSAEAGAKAEGGEWTSAYTVTVTNDGEVAGTSKPVTDTPSVPEGFKLEGATVDGTEVELVDGSFTVTDGVKLAAGKDKVFEVVLSGTYDAASADWVAVGECDITGEGDPAKGLFNKVAMEGDSDGPENNDACNPVSKDPSFKVKKDSAEAGAKAADGEWTSAYTVTVTNDGEVAGTSKPVTDTPSVPEGFTVTGATVDGEAVEITDGVFTVTDGVKLAAGKDKVFEVVLSGTYEAGKADWVAVGECDITGEGDPAKGLFNKVAMEGDSDGPENNDACNPVSKDPSFKVKKDSAEAGAKAEGGEWTSAYTVTVTNDGEVAGTSKAVTDTPSVPEGFTVTGATVDGEAVEITDGVFTVTDGVKLAAGEDKVFEVVLSGTYEAGKADWVAVGECDITGEGDPAKGLFNKVAMEGDSDGPENNDACNPVSKDPSFKVKKDSAEAGAKAEGGEWTSAYTVTVTNDGEVAGTSKAVTDTPSVPEGFTVTGATVDGEAVEITDGVFTVTDGVKLAAGEDKVFEVVLSGTYEAGKADWVAVGECETEGEGNPAKGLFNKVTMEEESDGPENNDACNPVSKDPSFKVKKDSAEAGAKAADGEWTSAYTVTVTNDGEIDGTSKAVTDTPSVPAGFELTEAKVDGETVELVDGSFTISEGVKLAAGEDKVFEVVLSGTYEAGKADWVAVGECETEGEGNPAKGLFNKVTMEEDSDGPENNDACNPVSKDPSFKVKKDSAEAGAKAADGEWMSAYTVTVTNDGEVAGTSKAVTDTPSVPEGFTITGATVDGTEVEITDGTFTVTDGVKLAAGEDKVFEVVLSGTYEADKADWVAVGECETEGEGNPAKGLFNKVTMEGDSDGPENNDACNPVSKDPSFKVKKDADTKSVVTSEGKTWKATYTVTVSNTGDVAGTSKAVTDTPSVPEGFTISGATVDGEAVEITEGTFTVTEGVKLKAGKAKTFTVTLIGDVAKSGVNWVAVGECETVGEGNPAKGLFNKVAMEDDSDGPENNDACVPVIKEGEPAFKVKKDADTKSVATAEGKTWKAVYSVTVSNVGDAAGTSKAVTDTPSVPEGFTVTGAEVDGKAVEITDGSFTVTEGVKLKAGKAKTFTVTLIGDVAKSGVDWAAAAECEITGEGNPAKGLFNKVTMENDSDGPDNNDACVPVVPPAPPEGPEEPEGPGDLSKTGADVLGIIGAGAGLLMLAGAMLVWRRRAAEH